MRTRRRADALERGVWSEPYMGPDGEVVLYSVTRHLRLVRWMIVPHGASRVDAAQELWDELERLDPDIRQIMKVV